jgi:hypothetical protein|tara:strand:- start:697 stop:1356 length:660 start_codon:yes stop_codon:yes gene_type:complete
MALNTLPAGAFADDAITADKINLANTFAFTGTVTGTTDLVLIKTVTISDDTTISFVNGSNGVVLDSTYKAYKIIGTGLTITESDGVHLTFNASIDTGSNYNVDKTNTGEKINRSTGGDNNTSTAIFNQNVTTACNILRDLDGNEANNQANFEMTLFEPSSTANFKFARTLGSYKRTGSYAELCDVITMLETTSAIDAIQFAPSGSNIDTGQISLYGVKS